MPTECPWAWTPCLNMYLQRGGERVRERERDRHTHTHTLSPARARTFERMLRARVRVCARGPQTCQALAGGRGHLTRKSAVGEDMCAWHRHPAGSQIFKYIKVKRKTWVHTSVQRER